MFMGLALTLVLVAAGVWYGGVWATRNGLWDAPWVVPHGIALEGEPQIGVAYQVSVYAHCGLRNVKFDGSEWGISGELGDGNPPPGINDLDTGTVTLTTADTAIWTTHLGEPRTLTRGTGLPDVEGCL
ncbi:MAG TPA: hypothetical protein VK845_16305 [Gemmatimonadales bacterium]|nr:hypothetical protein [Gemmatimonadales bacterium]